VFLTLVSLNHGRLIPVIEIMMSLLFLLFVGSIALVRQLGHYRSEIKTSALKRFFDQRFTKSIIQIYIIWLMRREPVLVIGTKIFAGLLIFAVTQLYKGEVYDWRLMAMGFTLALSANFMIIEQMHRFENFHFNLLRNLPIPTWQRLLINVSVFAFIFSPEMVVFIKNYPYALQWHYGLSIIFFGLSIGLLYYSTLFLNTIPAKDISRLIFGAVICWFVLILFSVPLLILIGINFLLGTLIFVRNFYTYDYSSREVERPIGKPG
jgi:hypothetical protein